MPGTDLFVNYFSTVINNISDGLLLIAIEPDDHFRILRMNDPFIKMSGYSKSYENKLIEDFLPEARYKVVSDYYRNVIATGAPVEYSSEMLGSKTGLAYHATLLPITNSLGDVRLILVIVTDLHSNVIASRYVDQVEDIITAVAEMHHGHIVVMSREGLAIYCSSGFHSLTSTEKNNGKPCNLFELMTNGDRKLFRKSMDDALAGKNGRCIIKMSLKGGKRPFICDIKPDRTGRLVVSLEELTDVTVS